jgi:hypothetical protein
MLWCGIELKYKQKDELKLARCWRDVLKGKLMEEEQIRVFGGLRSTAGG